MRRLFLIVPALIPIFGCATNSSVADAKREDAAIEFLRGIYTGDSSVVDRLAAPGIVVSYPIFDEIFGEPSIVGREAVRDFAEGFGKRWISGEVIIHDVIIRGDTAVVVWGFRARKAASDGGGQSTLVERAWGGITLYRFDGEDRIVFEIGEESTPGPAARIPDAFADP
jgi:hypothetical protein